MGPLRYRFNPWRELLKAVWKAADHGLKVHNVPSEKRGEQGMQQVSQRTCMTEITRLHQPCFMASNLFYLQHVS